MTGCLLLIKIIIKVNKNVINCKDILLFLLNNLYISGFLFGPIIGAGFSFWSKGKEGDW